MGIDCGDNVALLLADSVVTVDDDTVVADNGEEGCDDTDVDVDVIGMLKSHI